MYKDFGVYWIVGQKRYYSNYEAVTASVREGLPLEFYFFDKVFEKLDWTAEPPTSWPDLLKHRAEQLRQSYDYVRLWYSGGADSHTMLLAFLENEIPIDEIFLIRSSPSGEFLDLGNSEINKVAIPFLEKVKNQLGSTQVTVLDIGPDRFARLYLNDDWFHHINYFNLRPTTIQTVYKMYPDLNREISTSKVCDLHGGDKPKLGRDERGHFYSYYWDVQPGAHLGQDSLEQFYVSPDMPEVHLKQCHMAKNHLKNILPPDYPVEEAFKFGSPYYYEIDKVCRSPLFVDWSLGKSGELFGSVKSRCAFEQCQLRNPQLYDKLLSDLNSENKLYTERFNQGDINFGLKGVKTKMYNLGK